MVGGPGWPSCWASSAERMAAAGITAEARQRIFVDNPARAFAFTTSEG